MAEPTVAEMARAVARELEDESRWCHHRFAIDVVGVEYDEEGDIPDAGADLVKLCGEGHDWRLFGRDATPLTAAFRDRFGKRLCDSNDYDGREATRVRLLELAEAQS